MTARGHQGRVGAGAGGTPPGGSVGSRRGAPARSWARLGLWACLVVLLPASVAAQGADDPAGAAGRPDPGAPRWYLDRGTSPRVPLPADGVPSVVAQLQASLRDGRVPGFYDGQFASTSGAFDELARIARDEDIHAVMRMMAVMALQEAGDGERLAEVLEPLIIDPDLEFAIEKKEWEDFGATTDEEVLRRVLRADISRHARFALAKDGQPARVLEKIEVMERRVRKRKLLILDPRIRSERDPEAAWLRSVWFDIAYHHQQYDDYDSAVAWFRELADALEGDDTRWAHYNLACIAAIRSRPDEAMVELRAAVDAGFLDVEWLQEDGDLSSLRERPDFEALVVELGGTPKSNAGDAEGDPPR